MIMLLHEVLSVFFCFVFCFFVCWISLLVIGGCLSCYSGLFELLVLGVFEFVTRGVCFCLGVFSVGGVFGWGCWGGMRRLSFLESCTRNLRYYKSPELGLNLSGS